MATWGTARSSHDHYTNLELRLIWNSLPWCLIGRKWFSGIDIVCSSTEIYRVFGFIIRLKLSWLRYWELCSAANFVNNTGPYYHKLHSAQRAYPCQLCPSIFITYFSTFPWHIAINVSRETIPNHYCDFTPQWQFTISLYFFRFNGLLNLLMLKVCQRDLWAKEPLMDPSLQKLQKQNLLLPKVCGVAGVDEVLRSLKLPISHRF